MCFSVFPQNTRKYQQRIFCDTFEKQGLGKDRAWVWGTQRCLLGWVFTFQFWIGRTTLLRVFQSLRTPERWKHTHVTFYSSLTADRSCSRNAARLRTPYLADACREAQQHTPLTLPCPSDTAKSVNAAPMTLEMYRLAKGAHLLCLVLGGKRGLCAGVQKNGSLLGSVARPKQEGETLFQSSGLIRGGFALAPGMLAGLTWGLLSKLDTHSKLLCAGWSLYH